ncbi:protein CFAP20DC isoform X2 [Pogoniulus pusillus]|uniref:protein CFAP20DC isoform X2 n=1 Tax=Pogoniulus pusillus TaxID=488313 RepID=UPI0030B9742E
MFKNQYQGGPFVEIFSAQGKNPVAKWKICGNPAAIRKEYDKEIKGFVFVLEGSSQINKMQLPKETTQTLGLIQPFLTLQVFVPSGQDFSTVLMITDLGNIKRRLYLSTVRKEVSVTPLHAKIPLVAIKRKMWCNLCIDLIAFTSEIFRGAVFQSLDGIVVSANCKLRKIFTLKSKPQDTSEEDDSPVNRGQGSSKAQVVSHIAFGSKILGTPPSASRRDSARASGKVTKTWGGKDNRACRLQRSRKETESVQDVERLELSFSPCSDSLGDGGIRSAHQTATDVSLSEGWMFPESFSKRIQMDRSEQFVATEGSACRNLPSPQNASVEHHSNERGDHQVNNKEVFTLSPRPPSAPHEKSLRMSPESCVFPLDLKQDSNEVAGNTQTEDRFEGTDGSKEDDNSEFIRGTEKLEISSSQEGTSDSAVFKENPFWRMSWSNESWKNKEHRKHNLEETMASIPQSSTVREMDFVNSLSSLKPTLSLSPPGRESKFPEGIPHRAEKTERCAEVPGQLKGSISKKSPKQVSRENSCLPTETCEYDWKKYQSDGQSSAELQVLASMKRQQKEELQETEISHGLSASQTDSCNVSNDTATWNSCFSPCVSQEHHYQEERSQLSLSSPWDSLSAFSPPIISGSQQLEEHTKSSPRQSIPGEDDLSAEEDEVLTLLYDPCLNCYFDPSSGKYYDLA